MQRHDQDFSADLFRRALHASTTPTLIVRCKGDSQRIIYANPAFAHIAGYTVAEVIGRPWHFLYAREHNAGAPSPSEPITCEAASQGVSFWGTTKDGRVMWLDVQLSFLDGQSEWGAPLFIAEIHDLTAVRAEREQLTHSANHDCLTGLPNRRLLQDRLNHAIARVRRHGEMFAVAFIDLDGFKFINDTFGHATGDEILRQVGRRLESGLRAGDTAARVGGDEFVLLVEDGAEDHSVVDVIDRMLKRIQQPITIDGSEFTLSCSVGITRCPADGLDPTTLVRNADYAMYEGKRYGEKPRGWQPAATFLGEQGRHPPGNRVTQRFPALVAIAADRLASPGAGRNPPPEPGEHPPVVRIR